MTEAIRVINAKYVSDYSVLLLFSDNTEQTVDFQKFLQKNPHPQFSKYLDMKNFKKFKIENGNIVWGKDWDLIFPVEELYTGELSGS
ncbi:DUF2442 domain-containing protein [Dyadobacter sp. CY312]|uniref:DUF2442 domain-containing protein n=1 Tax=Dyadobacter sp. CY312 TaxID=2907303 RepID=UPI001F2D82AA|nr:DUF2442 domain-containing protein [Dyadobacter sp. CY312]MCE7044170.1 DUF2442 domain-containing protein [Dyadobacter sp. CY312]